MLTIARKLALGEGDIVQARSRLLAQGFVLYRAPLYQSWALADDRP